MWSKKFIYKDVIERILICPLDNRVKSARAFWIKETTLFKKLYKKHPNENFWNTLNLYDTNCGNGKVSSLAYFFDSKNYYWSSILKKKWKDFNWIPPKIKSYEFKKDIEVSIEYKTNKRGLRGFFN